MSAVYGLYPDGQSAQAAVDALRSAGVEHREITIISCQPMEDFEFGRRDKQTWMWWIASGGGLVGFSVSTWMTRMAQQAWPLVTGGMPITPWWSNLIITFELTMLGAIIATVITLLVTAGLPARRRKLLYDPEVTNGKILVGLEDSAARSVTGLYHLLSAPRGAVVKIV